MKKLAAVITLLVLSGTAVYAAVVLRQARRHHADVRSAIDELPSQDGVPFRVEVEQTELEGKLNALFILGIVNLLNVSSCLAISVKRSRQHGNE